MENAWLSVPFTFLGQKQVFHGPDLLWLTSLYIGLVTEAGSSVSFVNRSKWRAVAYQFSTHSHSCRLSGCGKGKRNFDLGQEADVSRPASLRLR